MQNLFTREIPAQASDIRLAAGQTHARQLAQPMRLTVCQGLVWLTLEQGGADIWLQGGQQFDLPAHGLVVIEAAKGDARFRLSLRDDARPAGLMRLLPHGLMRWS